MKKFVALAVTTMFTAGASIAAAQCPTCSGTAAPVFSQAQPVYAAPAAPVYSQPVYSTPAAPVYSAPATPVYTQPIVSTPAPVYSGSSSCCGGCGTSNAIIGGEATYTSYDSTALTVGSVINGETVVSVGESTIVGTTDPGQEGEMSKETNVIDGNVETSTEGEVVAPPMDDSKPQPEGEMMKEEMSKDEMTEGDA